jgi:hypothetical protein
MFPEKSDFIIHCHGVLFAASELNYSYNKRATTGAFFKKRPSKQLNEIS